MWRRKDLRTRCTICAPLRTGEGCNSSFCIRPTTTKLIFKHMKDNDVKRMINTMSALSKSPIWMVKRVLEEFYSSINEDSELLFSENKGRDFILGTLGEDRANNSSVKLSMLVIQIPLNLWSWLIPELLLTSLSMSILKRLLLSVPIYQLRKRSMF